MKALGQARLQVDLTLALKAKGESADFLFEFWNRTDQLEFVMDRIRARIRARVGARVTVRVRVRVRVTVGFRGRVRVGVRVTSSEQPEHPCEE
jgi:hypothetical protein